MAGEHGGGGGGNERWLVTYADMLTLLLALFIILYSVSKADAQKFERFQQGMQQAFHVDVLQGRDAPALTSGGAIVAQDASTTIAPVPKPTLVPTAPFTTVRQSGPLGQPVGLQVAEPEGQPITPTPANSDTATVQKLRRDFQGLVPANTRGNIVVTSQPQGIAISIYGVLLFDSGKADLQPNARKILMKVAQSIAPLPYDIHVEGNTDSIQPTGGPYPSNWDLSIARALVVTHFLIDSAHITPNRLSATGYAGYRPVASNATRAGRLRNRRVDLILVRKNTSP